MSTTSDMAHIATPEFLLTLKQLYPPQSTYVKSPWYAVAAITFTASNRPEAVPLVLDHVLNDLDAIGASHEDRLAAARKIRDGVFKSGMICGFPKVASSLSCPTASSELYTPRSSTHSSCSTRRPHPSSRTRKPCGT